MNRVRIAWRIRLQPDSVRSYDPPMLWTDSEDIAIALREAHPDIDPLTVRFTQLREWILQLPGFDDDPQSSNEARLEAIQMAWHEEFKENW